MQPEDQWKICKERFDRAEETDKLILSKLDSFDKKLFMDNGAECLQSKINRHDRWIKAVAGFLVVLGAATTTIAVRLITKWITKS